MTNGIDFAPDMPSTGLLDREGLAPIGSGCAMKRRLTGAEIRRIAAWIPNPGRRRTGQKPLGAHKIGADAQGVIHNHPDLLWR